MQYSEGNLAALAVRNRALADRLATCRMDITGLAVGTSSSGRAYLAVKDERGVRPIDSAVDPAGEAKEIISRTAADARVLVMKGAGLGYLVKAAGAARHLERIVIVEPQLPLFALMLGMTDLRRELRDERVEVFAGDAAIDAVRMLKTEYDFSVESSASMPVLPPCTVLKYPLFDALFERKFDDAWNSLRNTSERNRSTLTMFVDMWRENIAANISSMLAGGTVSSMRGLADGATAFLVGAGPSLDANVHELRKAEGRGLIVVVDSAYRTLVSIGVTPDLVIAVDATEENLRDFDGVEVDRERTALVMVPVVDSRIPPKFTKRFTASYGHPLQKWIERNSGIEFGSLLVSGSVSTIGFDLLRLMKARKIVLVGMDMALGKGGHTRGYFRSGGVSRFLSMESSLREPQRDDAAEVPGWGGGTVRSTPQMRRWIEWFARECGRGIVRTVNATEGGARIPGVEESTLSDEIGKLGNGVFRSAMRVTDIVDEAVGKLKRKLIEVTEDDALFESESSFILKWERAVLTAADSEKRKSALKSLMRAAAAGVRVLR